MQSFVMIAVQSKSAIINGVKRRFFLKKKEFKLKARWSAEETSRWEHPPPPGRTAQAMSANLGKGANFGEGARMQFSRWGQ